MSNDFYIHLLRICDRVIALHERKAADYGSDEDVYANIRASEDFGIAGWQGALLRQNDKLYRAKRFIAKGELVNESIEDTLDDNVAYAVIARVLYEQEKKVAKLFYSDQLSFDSLNFDDNSVLNLGSMLDADNLLSFEFNQICPNYDTPCNCSTEHENGMVICVKESL